MAERLEQIERGQRRIALRQRHMPARVTKALTEAMTRRAALLIAAGIILGSALGGAAMELARKLVTSVLVGR